MKLGFIGLGRMGSNMVMNLMDHKHKVIGYNRSSDSTRKLVRRGMVGVFSVGELVLKLGTGKKVVWLMIPAGKAVDDTIKELLKYLRKGDVIIDGGNSFFEDSIRRGKMLKWNGIHYLDCGVSGGIEGARGGACMMVGGEKKVFAGVEKLFRDLCVEKGYGYMGKQGAGHFVKMVHNGIEYGMMGAIAEGFLANEKFGKKFGLNMKEIAKVYSHGSIIESKLISWLWDSYKEKGYLSKIACEVPKGETEDEMGRLGRMAKMPVLKKAREMRVKSRKGAVCGSLVAAMRNRFGGHEVKRK